MEIVIRRAFGERMKKLGLSYRRVSDHPRIIFSLAYGTSPTKIQKFLCGVGAELAAYEALTSLDFASKVRLYTHCSKIWFFLLDDGRCKWHDDDGPLVKVRESYESNKFFLMYNDGGKYIYKENLDLIQRTILETYINELDQLSKIYIKEIEKIFLEKDENGKPKYYSTKHILRPMFL